MNTYAALSYEYKIFKRRFQVFEDIEIGDKIFQSTEDDILCLDKKCFYQGIVRIWKGENRTYTMIYLNALFDKYIQFLKAINEFIERNSRAIIETIVSDAIDLNATVLSGLETLMETYGDYADLIELHEKIRNIFRVFKVSTTISNSRVITPRYY
jgi:hypothetical protein